jgi:hypothetical protein
MSTLEFNTAERLGDSARIASTATKNLITAIEAVDPAIDDVDVVAAVVAAKAAINFIEVPDPYA